MRHTFESKIGHIVEAWCKRDARLHQKWHAALDDYERTGRVAAAVEEELVKLREERTARRQQLGDSVGWHLSDRAYYLIVAMATLPEFALNIVVFRTFGESELLTWGMSTVSLLLPILGHFMGATLRRADTPSKMGWGGWTLMLLSLVAVLSVVGFGAQVRRAYAKPLADLTGIQLSPGTAAGVYIAFGMLPVLVSGVLAYLRSDPAWVALERTRREVAATEARLTRRADQRTQAQRRLNRARSQRIITHRVALTRVERLRKEFMRQLHVYRKCNGRSRKDGESPRFAPVREIHVPPALEKFAWDAAQAGEPSGSPPPGGRPQ